jgi:hypothetical protein
MFGQLIYFQYKLVEQKLLPNNVRS